MTDLRKAPPPVQSTWDGRERRIEHRSRVRSQAGDDAALEYLAGCIERIDQRLDNGSDRMDLMQEELTRNTEVTTEVRDLLQMAKAGLRVLGGIGQAARWFGGLAAAAAAIWALWQAIRHGTPPKG